jgi:type II secretory pathway pseudopilin PulG
MVLTLGGCLFITRDYEAAKRRANEDALQTALKYMRQAISDYKRDHGEAPEKLDDLVQGGYFNSLPIDPMTNKSDWSVEFQKCNSPSPCKKLIKDVHSSSTARSSKNDLYSEW